MARRKNKKDEVNNLEVLAFTVMGLAIAWVFALGIFTIVNGGGGNIVFPTSTKQ